MKKSQTKIGNWKISEFKNTLEASTIELIENKKK